MQVVENLANFADVSCNACMILLETVGLIMVGNLFKPNFKSLCRIELGFRLVVHIVETSYAQILLMKILHSLRLQTYKKPFNQWINHVLVVHQSGRGTMGQKKSEDWKPNSQPSQLCTLMSQETGTIVIQQLIPLWVCNRSQIFLDNEYVAWHTITSCVIISTLCNHWEQNSNPSNICASYGKATTPEAS